MRRLPILCCMFVAAILFTSFLSSNALPGKRQPRSVLIIAPHPDDEALGCAGVIQQALAEGSRVTVVILTNGDSYDTVAALLGGKVVSQLTLEDYINLGLVRQQETIAAMRKLGLADSNIVFLGYGNGMLELMSRDTAPLKSKKTGRISSYTGVPATSRFVRVERSLPYQHDTLVWALAEIIRLTNPSTIYVTDSTDGHPDHSATFYFAKAARAAAQSSAEVRSYLIHAGVWWPGPPSARFEQFVSKGVTYPPSLPWPPPVRIALTKDQQKRKLAAIDCYTSQLLLGHEAPYLRSFAREEEIFWVP